jgi:hypothetical protein
MNRFSKKIADSLRGLLAVTVALTMVLTGCSAARKPIAVRGVIGSEKQDFFRDPQVVKVFADHGLKITVDSAGSRQIATSVDLGTYDFAFPSSAPAADKIQRERGITVKYAPFSSPMVVATFQPIAVLLAAAGIGKNGPAGWTFDVARYLELVSKGTRWDQLRGNTVYPVRKDVLVSTTDPRSSNSAAMYLAIASYVANGSTVVQGTAAENKVLPLMSKLFLGQGYTENTTEGPFEDYLSAGMGKTPLVLAYEAQFVGHAVRGDIRPDMLLMYPSPTVLSKHTLVPLDARGDTVGRLLTSDPELQRLAALHGFRTTSFAKVAAERRVRVAPDIIDIADPPSYDTLEHLLDGIAKRYGTPE